MRLGERTKHLVKRLHPGDIAVVWPKPDTPILITAYVQGGAPNAAQIEAVFARIGRMVAERLA